MSDFDPIETAEGARSHRFYPPTPAHLPRFGAHGAWQAGMQALIDVLSGWWVGEPRRFDDVLERAAEWLFLPDDEGAPWGDQPCVSEALHRHARALAAHMLGHDDGRLWIEAATAIGRTLSDPTADAYLSARALDLCRRMGEPVAPPGALEDPPTAALLRTMRDEGAEMLTARPGLEPSTLYFYAFGRLGGVTPRSLCPLFCYVTAPELPLPPALRERGWSDAVEARARLPSRVDFGRLDRLLRLLGLARDPDAIVQPARPEFASWTSQPGLELEVDWHAPAGAPPWLEMRGRAAGRVAAALAEALGGTLAPGGDSALAAILAVPPAAKSAGNAQVRWEILAATVRAAPEVERRAAEPLVEAGLRDPDWRVRMTAVWGVGALRITRLADAASAAPLPDSGYDGLNGDDRRTLLALRDAASDRAAGRGPGEPHRDGAGPGGARRAAFVGRIAALFDILAPPPGDRHEALVLALLMTPGLASSQLPRAWAKWLGPASPPRRSRG